MTRRVAHFNRVGTETHQTAGWSYVIFDDAPETRERLLTNTLLSDSQVEDTLKRLRTPKILVGAQYQHKFDGGFTATVKMVDGKNIYFELSNGTPRALGEAAFRNDYEV